MTAQLDWLDSQPVVLSAGFPERMALLDCETTGVKATYHRITELAIILVDDGRLVEQWLSLINPEMPIPPEIQRMTGITPAIVRDAPVFADIAEAVRAKLEGRVLVAHNARFDYGFLKNEFARAGHAFTARPLCSVKISRQLYPQYQSHSLSALIRRFDFTATNRHRALDDALMIWKFFQVVSATFAEERIRVVCGELAKRPAMPAQLDAEEVNALPRLPGVYYFYDNRGKLLYVGKSINLYARVLSHFSQDYRNAKDLEMSGLIAHVDFVRTPSDFGAQLLESRQIKQLSPHFNRRLRKLKKLYQYQLHADQAGYLRIRIAQIEQADHGVPAEQFGLFRSLNQAESRLAKLAEHYFLCQKLCGLQAVQGTRAQGACFAFQLKRCLGACCAQESAETYNERVNIALKDYRYKAWPWPNAILVEERSHPGDSWPACGHLLYEWRYLAKISSQDELYDRGYQLSGGQPSVYPPEGVASAEDVAVELDFDLDVYLILVRFLLNPELLQQNRMRILPLVSI